MTPEPAPTSSIFRKVSLERLSSPEQLDTMMRATDPQGWLALLTIGLLLAGALVWSLVATIPLKVTGGGILLKGHGMTEVFSLATGVLAEVYVKPGDEINVTDKLALVLDADTIKRRRELMGAMETTQTALKTATPDQAPALQAQLKASQTELDQVMATGTARGTVHSQFRGKVLEVLGEQWDLVTAGSHIFYIEPLDQPLEAMLYVAASDASRITKGMAVQIFPDNARREEYGCMEGVVDTVNQYPSSPDDLRRKFGNDALVAALMGGRTVVQVTAKLNVDATTPSHFQWSSGRGPNFEIRSGTLCSGAVIIAEQHPIRLVLP